MPQGRLTGSLATPPSQRVPEDEEHILEWVWRPAEGAELRFSLQCGLCRTRYATISLAGSDGPVKLPAIAHTLDERLRDRQAQLAYTACPARSLEGWRGYPGDNEGSERGDRTADLGSRTRDD